MLADGSRVAVDAVVAATGFRTGLEPLVGHLGVLDERGRPLVRDVEEPAGAPGLHFVGYEVTLGGTLRRAGIEAKQLASCGDGCAPTRARLNEVATLRLEGAARVVMGGQLQQQRVQRPPLLRVERCK